MKKNDLFAPIMSIFYIVFLLLFSIRTTALSLDDIYKDLFLHYPEFRGITYDVPSINTVIADDWLLQTPNLWDSDLETYNKSFTAQTGHGLELHPGFFVPTCNRQSDCSGVSTCQVVNFTIRKEKLCLTKAHNIYTQIYNAMTNAQESVDIVTLDNNDSSIQGFKALLKNAIYTLALRSIFEDRTIVIRFLEGSYSTIASIIGKIYINDILSDLPKNHRLIISTAEMRSCFLNLGNCGNYQDTTDLLYGFAWNHGKIINIDDNLIITGGQNFYGLDYTEKNPVNDSNIKIYGDVAKGATVYTNILWKYVAEHRGFFSNFCTTYHYEKKTNECVTNMRDVLPPQQTSPNQNRAQTILNPLDSAKPVKAMYVSKLNNGVGVGDEADQSELARVFALRNAEKSIKISQQEFFARGVGHITHNRYLHPHWTIEGNVIYALSYAMHHNSVHTYIVTSNTDPSGKRGGYASSSDLEYLYDCFVSTLQKEFGLDTYTAREELNQYLHLGSLGYSPSTNPTDPKLKSLLTSHNKFWMVDDKIFYFGSHNFFPTSMQEFGVIVEADTNVSDELLQNFWNPMWNDAMKYSHSST